MIQDQKIHSILGSSNANIYMNCPGAINLIKKSPPDESSDAAEEGTAAHSLLEHCLNEVVDPHTMLGQKIGAYSVTEEMASAVKVCMDHVFRRRQEVGGVLHVEVRFELNSIHKDAGGTADIVIYKQGARLIVDDFKYGVDPVEAVDSKQLLFLALGAALTLGWDFSTVEMSIIQPRAPHHAGPIRTWVVSKDYLVSWSNVFAEAARLTDKKDAPLSRGDHCKYCRAKGICPKMNEVAETALDIRTTDSEFILPAVTALSDIQIANIMKHKKLIEDFLDGVKGVALHRLKSGEALPGVKLVAGRGKRIWADEKIAAQFLYNNLGEKAFKKALITPSAAEELLNKKLVEEFTVWIDGEPTATHEGDRRKAIQPLSGELILNSKRSM